MWQYHRDKQPILFIYLFAKDYVLCLQIFQIHLSWLKQRGAMSTEISFVRLLFRILVQDSKKIHAYSHILGAGHYLEMLISHWPEVPTFQLSFFTFRFVICISLRNTWNDLLIINTFLESEFIISIGLTKSSMSPDLKLDILFALLVLLIILNQSWKYSDISHPHRPHYNLSIPYFPSCSSNTHPTRVTIW